MALFEGKTPAERNKLIAAIVLGAMALVSLGYLFFGWSSGSGGAKPNLTKKIGQPSPAMPNRDMPPAESFPDDDSPTKWRPVSLPGKPPAASEPGRNIFAYYEPPPPPSPTPSIAPTAPPPPTPTPPSLILAGIAPANVYARTGDFTITVSGDKFTPQCRIYVGNSELPTRFVNAQQLTANVPAALITSEGAPQVVVRTPDNNLFSNTATLNVSAPPTPNYTYVGNMISKRGGNDIATLRDKNSREVLNVQRGDVLGGRFRVTSISERELVVTDTSLRINHRIPFSGGDNSSDPNRRINPNQPTYQPPAKSDDDDDEP